MLLLSISYTNRMTFFSFFFSDKGLLNGLLYVQIHSGRGFHKNGNPFKVNKKYGFFNLEFRAASLI